MKPTHVWMFDPNRRVYAPPPPGKIYSPDGPIYREHWRKVEVTGETTRSWLTRRGKVPKKGADPRTWLFCEADVERDAWAHDHRHKILGRLQFAPPDIIERIAQLIGYSPRPPISTSE